MCAAQRGSPDVTGFGWTYLSREALRRAEAQLSGETAGVRDEIGFLLIHQRYADQFFPGTSVLHTRLRYVLFVPWMYEDLRRGPPVRSIARTVQQAEVDIAGRLRAQGSGAGVIGGMTYPDPTSQPPSVVYWTALGVWGLLRPRASGPPPTRASVHAALQAQARTATDDDGLPLRETEFPFITLPAPPDEWRSEADLDFELTHQEAEFLSARLRAVTSPNDPSTPSLLARLAEHGVPDAGSCWSGEIVELAGQDSAALVRSGQAASLAAIGRGVYAALVEELRHTGDGRATSRLHRDALPAVVEAHQQAALQLNQQSLLDDVGGLPEVVVTVLTETLAWLAAGGGDPAPLRVPYAAAERARKRQRARLTDDLSGRERRLEWENTQHTLAEPLHFRWGNVQRLISDLWAPA
jgi:hypothetical protein